MIDSEPDAAPPSTPAELAALELLVDDWCRDHVAQQPFVGAVERDPGPEPRWYLRLIGDEKPVFTVWMSLRQRTFHVETYLMPAPLERHAELYEYLLRRNRRLYGMSFTIGLEDAIYLEGQVPNVAVTEAELDRLLGSAYAYTEAHFRAAMRIGYGDRFTG